MSQVVVEAERPERRNGLRGWLLDDLQQDHAPVEGPHIKPGQAPGRPWWQVMCLTGLDYFSTLGYQPGIAALAAGALAPVATIVLVALTLLGALPVYRHVARESPHGQGSIAMLERILPKWSGKLFVLVLLGFAATDFIITITLSAADASAHVLENPYTPAALHGHRMGVTLVLLALLGAVFLRGFKEAISIAVVLVGVYLTLNLVVVVFAFEYLATHPHLVAAWRGLLVTQYPSPLAMVAVALLVFPRLALGLSGFETGVAVMPLIRTRRPGDLEDRIRGAHKLLTTAALIMSGFLITSSIVTTILIPQREFKPGGKAYGRALAYLAHEHFGNIFGTAYDASTVLILWFAGASAMAGLLNLIPRYLPRYGMAPAWTRAIRPLVLVLTVIAFAVTSVFRADVNAQGGAYATGVLVLITSAAVAVTLSARRHGYRRLTVAFAVVTLILVYTTIANIFERPEGVKIASLFIAGIIAFSLLSRIARATELRATGVEMDDASRRFIEDAAGFGEIHIVANEPQARDEAEYREKEAEQRRDNHIPDDAPVLLMEVNVADPSDFETPLRVHGEERHGYRILRVDGPSVPNAIAAVLLCIRNLTGKKPHVYFNWAEGNPVVALIRYLLFGEGENATLTREVLREAEQNYLRRPMVHVS